MDDDFMDGWADENRVSSTDAAWYAWIGAVEALIGGDFEAVTGQSMDYAYEAWQAGQTVPVYTASIHQD